MDLNSPLFDRVRIRSEEADVRARTDTRRCDHPGCEGLGEFRAPKGRQREGQFFFFCLPHVQAYNKSYNYFAGMSDHAISDFQKDSITGHRPTWSMGARRGEEEGKQSYTTHDPMGVFGDAARRSGPERPQASRYGLLAKKALETLHLDETATPETIRAKYKGWVKKLHPDANGGDRSREEKLAEIIRAYGVLKSGGHV